MVFFCATKLFSFPKFSSGWNWKPIPGKARYQMPSEESNTSLPGFWSQWLANQRVLNASMAKSVRPRGES